jgi:hypothetical protein
MAEVLREYRAAGSWGSSERDKKCLANSDDRPTHRHIKAARVGQHASDGCHEMRLPQSLQQNWSTTFVYHTPHPA